MAGKERSTMQPPLIESDRCWGGQAQAGRQWFPCNGPTPAWAPTEERGEGGPEVEDMGALRSIRRAEVPTGWCRMGC